MRTEPLLVDAKTGASLLGICERQFHLYRHRPDFPKPLDSLGQRLVRWRRSDLEGWIANLPTKARNIEEPTRLRAGRARKAERLADSGSTSAETPA